MSTPIALWGRVETNDAAHPTVIARIEQGPHYSPSGAGWSGAGRNIAPAFTLQRQAESFESVPTGLAVRVPPSLDYLAPGDIVRVDPAFGQLNVLFRASTRFNALLVTERCNSNCVMCSQPPRDKNDSFLIDVYRTAMRLMPASTPELCITGGEPTLLGEGFFELVEDAKTLLPDTALHVLTNGRSFAYLPLAQRLAAIDHSDLMLGIPLYSDVPARHDFVVQAAGAFDQTMRGLLNLGRVGVQIELRVVLQQATVERLPRLTDFIARHLPFVHHVALMGLELTGHVPMHLDALWIDPADYQDELAAAVRTLAGAGVRPVIFNHQLCVLKPELRPFAVRSISDWKNIYEPECQGCGARAECGGFFASGKLRKSRAIAPVGSQI